MRVYEMLLEAAVGLGTVFRGVDVLTLRTELLAELAPSSGHLLICLRRVFKTREQELFNDVLHDLICGITTACSVTSAVVLWLNVLVHLVTW